MRLAGIIIAIFAITFIWLYDTGRWNEFVSVIKTGNVSNVLNSQVTSGTITTGTGFSLNGSGIPPYLQQAICAQFPDQCPGSVPGISNTIGALPGGSNTITSILLGNIFG